MIANEDKDTGTIQVSKEIVEKGTYRKDNTILLDRNSSFLLDFLSIGKQKYRELRRFLKEEQVFITSYNRVAKFRQETCLVNELRYFDKGFGTPVGIYHPYQSIATQTISQIIEAERSLQDANYPLTTKLIDGLDGSGSYSIHNQLRNHPDITTKDFLLFAFKVIWLKDSFENIWTDPSPNSPFTFR